MSPLRMLAPPLLLGCTAQSAAAPSPGSSSDPIDATDETGAQADPPGTDESTAAVDPASTGDAHGTTGGDPVDPITPAPGTWIAIEPGTFTMGALVGDPCPMGTGNDVPHEVTLTLPFEISATEVTYAELEAATGVADPDGASCLSCPVAMVTWHDAAAICNAYSVHAGLPECYACAATGGAQSCDAVDDPHACDGYRLPTEAEWEYAARAGTTTGVHGGQLTICESADPLLDAHAWYLYDADGGTHPVASKLANAWGLFDTSGNVWEWTHDGYVTDLSTLPATDPVASSPDGLRVMRGGSYNCIPGEVRLAHRSGLPAEIAGLNVGLRCARTLAR